MIFLFLYRAYNATIVVKETVTIANMIGSEIALVVGLIIDTNVDATAFFISSFAVGKTPFDFNDSRISTIPLVFSSVTKMGNLSSFINLFSSLGLFAVYIFLFI